MNYPAAIEQPPTAGGESPISVKLALPEQAGVNWAMYAAGWIAAKSTVEGLSPEKAERHFKAANDVEGTSITDWIGFIKDRSGQQVVFNAWLPPFDGPVGLARATVDAEGQRQLKNVSVAERAQGMGVFSAILEETIKFHEGNPFTLIVAEANQDARAVYKKRGFELTGNSDIDHVAGIEVVRLEMIHPGS